VRGSGPRIGRIERGRLDRSRHDLGIVATQHLRSSAAGTKYSASTMSDGDPKETYLLVIKIIAEAKPNRPSY
jgi:hypothetical protein